MRVLFLSKSCPVYGGVERWLADLGCALRDRGHECVVALANGFRFHSAGRYRSAYPELAYMELDGTTGSEAGRRLAVRRALTNFQPDIVIPVMLADGLAEAIRLKSKLGYRIVYPVHEIGHGVRCDLQRCGSWMDRIVFVDHSGPLAYAREIAGFEERCLIIPCGVPPVAHPHRSGPEGLLRIGFCGRLEQAQKRALDLVTLCSRLDEIDASYQIDVVGEGSASPVLERELSTQIGSGKVRMRGSVSRDELYRTFYPYLDVLLITSEWETGPLVAFEAMMNGCLVITADFAGRKENSVLVDGANCLVFPVGNMVSATQQLTWVMAHPDLAKNLAERGRELATTDRSLEIMANRWNRLLCNADSETPICWQVNPNEVMGGNSRLRRLGVPDALAEAFRHLTKRRFVHASPGEEWPFYSGYVK